MSAGRRGLPARCQTLRSLTTDRGTGHGTRPFVRARHRLAADLVRIPLLPGEAVAARIVAELFALGLYEARTDRAGKVVGRIAGTGGPPLLLSSHMEVVDAGDVDAWEHHPYGGTVAGAEGPGHPVRHVTERNVKCPGS